jgi:hypothetical protein
MEYFKSAPNRKHVEMFMKAYKEDTGEELEYKEAYEMVHRLVNVCLILERGAYNLQMQTEEKARLKQEKRQDPNYDEEKEWIS